MTTNTEIEAKKMMMMIRITMSKIMTTMIWREMEIGGGGYHTGDSSLLLGPHNALPRRRQISRALGYLIVYWRSHHSLPPPRPGPSWQVGETPPPDPKPSPSRKPSTSNGYTTIPCPPVWSWYRTSSDILSLVHVKLGWKNPVHWSTLSRYCNPCY